jgi:ribosomal protein S18 acetylase RimI-like enzyme
LVKASAKETILPAIPRPAVRAATFDDAADLAAVHVRSWQAAYKGLLPQDCLDELDRSFTTERWQRHLRAADWPKAGVVVAVPGPELVGFARFGPSRDEDDDCAAIGEIMSIYVAPEAWGQGLGRWLMTSALAKMSAAGYPQATLWVLDSNTRARRFYERGGWAEDGTAKRRESLGFPIRELRYRKQLA